MSDIDDSDGELQGQGSPRPQLVNERRMAYGFEVHQEVSVTWLLMVARARGFDNIEDFRVR